MTSSWKVGKLSERNFLKYLEWEIPNFSHWSEYPYPEEFIISPTFTFENNSWHISLRPYGDLSMFLMNETQSPRNVNYSFSIKGSDDTLVEYRANNATIWNKSDFTGFFDINGLLRDEDDYRYELFLLPYDTLTIVCILNPGENEEMMQQAFNYTAPKASKIVGELSERDDLRQLQWKIPNFPLLADFLYPKKFLVSPTFIFENTSWHINLCPHGNLSVFLINEAQHPCHVNYSFSIKNANGTLVAYEDNNTFIKDKSGFTIFHDTDLLEDEDMLGLSDTLTIVCILKPGENEKASSYTEADNNGLKSKVKSPKLMKFTESEMKLKEQLESECKRLEEAVNTVNLQKDEIEKLRCENRKCNDELAELKKLNCDLQNKLDAIISQNGSKDAKSEENPYCRSKVDDKTSEETVVTSDVVFEESGSGDEMESDDAGPSKGANIDSAKIADVDSDEDACCEEEMGSGPNFDQIWCPFELINDESSSSIYSVHSESSDNDDKSI